MHPRFFYPHPRFHTGPSRLLWFVIGAASATWWIHRKEHANPSNQHHFGRCIRPPVPPLAVEPQPNRDTLPPMQNPANRSPPWGYPEAHRARQFDEEKAKLQAIGRQAEDVMTKLSEDALDSVMTTMEALKRKLAEHREERLRVQRQLEKQIEEQHKDPHRFV
ncbi:hypothetical protein MIND_00341600 [Mycena indigotica]|uniref:Uncharacterized protein n=1 Tax=Mycena indigotica TaxID=2126181 RepID=A0A8H6WEP9_9AGAR|nr:uncharacterized protein MIND_00341600 [Mycena indigotica]KAF7309699.1 hypothetical protein MIND_00341600 [Mycena indigotica]